jgi:hypothetical protein
MKDLRKNWFQRLQEWAITQMAKVTWKTRDRLSEQELSEIRNRCKKDYYIIATRKKNYLSTFFIALGHFLLTGKWGYFSHVLMNLEDAVRDDSDFRFIEATGKGVHYSTFTEVFGTVQSVALIVPTHMSMTNWTKALDKARTLLGRPYDNLFDLKNDLEINCVELIRIALQETPDYDKNFAEFEKLAKRKKKLTPDMFVNCPDFKVVYEIKD